MNRTPSRPARARTWTLALALAALAAAMVPAGAIEQTTTRKAFDDSTWQYNHPPDAIGVAITEAAKKAYNTMIHHSAQPCAGTVNPQANWGFVAKDTDCFLPLNVPLGCGATFTGGALNSRIDIHPGFRECYYAQFGFYANTGQPLTKVANAVVGHEFFHYVQQAHDADQNWDAFQEGTARFVQTLLEPELEAEDGSLWYGGTSASSIGVKYLMHHPDTPMCDHRGSFGLYWGFLYDQDDDVAGLRAIVDAVGDLAPGLDCAEGLAQAVDAALTAPFATHAEAMAAFAEAVYRKDFTWKAWGASTETNFGAYLPNVHKEVQGPGSVERSLGAWALQYVQLPSSGTYTVTLTARDGGAADWSQKLYLQAVGGGLTTQELAVGTPVTVDGGAFGEVLVVSVRTAANAGDYTLTVAAA